jgi:acetyl/propionyl-CoA carboxylase alpha subunit
VKLCQSIGYKSAGTVEFIVDQNQNFYFLEVNTRIQVEHPVTEMRTGIDIVEEQIRIETENGERKTENSELPVFRSPFSSFQGHAIELRIYAEDPENNFLPTPGKVTAYHEPQVRGARVDSSIDGPCPVSEAYDPMIAKLICYGKTRQAAIETAQQALKEFILQGLTTNKAYLWEVIKNEDFIENRIDTSFCATHQEELLKALNESRHQINLNDIAVSFLLYDFCKKRFEQRIENVWEDIGFWRFHSQFHVDVEGEKIPVHIQEWKVESEELRVESEELITSHRSPSTARLISHDGHQLKLMLNGRTEVVYCSVDDEQKTIVNFHGLNFRCYRTDQLNDTLDYSRKEQVNDKSRLVSPMPGKVVKINVKEGDEVSEGTVMIVVEAMKMENNITATAKAKVKRILVEEGEMVDNKKQLIELEERIQK